MKRLAEARPWLAVVFLVGAAVGRLRYSFGHRSYAATVRRDRR